MGNYNRVTTVKVEDQSYLMRNRKICRQKYMNFSGLSWYFPETVKYKKYAKRWIRTPQTSSIG